MDVAIFSGIVTQELLNINAYDFFIPLFFSFAIPKTPSITFQKCKIFYEGRYSALIELEVLTGVISEQQFLLAGKSDIVSPILNKKLPLDELSNIVLFRHVNKALFNEMYVRNKVVKNIKGNATHAGLWFKHEDKFKILDKGPPINSTLHSCLNHETMLRIEMELMSIGERTKTLLHVCQSHKLSTEIVTVYELSTVISNLTKSLTDHQLIFDRNEIGRFYEHSLVECLITEREILMTLKAPVLRVRATAALLRQVLNPVFANGNRSCPVALDHRKIAVFESTHYLEVTVLECNNDRLCGLRELLEVNSVHSVCLETLMDEVKAEELRSVCSLKCIDNNYVRAIEYLQDGTVLVNPGDELMEIHCPDKVKPVELLGFIELIAITLPCDCSISWEAADGIQSQYHCDHGSTKPKQQQWVPVFVTDLTGEPVRQYGLPITYQDPSDLDKIFPKFHNSTNTKFTPKKQITTTSKLLVIVLLICMVLSIILMRVLLSRIAWRSLCGSSPLRYQRTPYAYRQRFADVWNARNTYEAPICRATCTTFDQPRPPPWTPPQPTTPSTPVAVTPPLPPAPPEFPTIPRTFNGPRGNNNHSQTTLAEYIDMTSFSTTRRRPE